MLFLANGLLYAAWIPRLPEIRRSLDMSDTVLGLTLVGAGIGGLLTSLVSGRLVDRFGSRTISVAGTILLAATIPFVAIAPAAIVLFGVLIAVGSNDGVTDVAINAQGVELQRGIERSILTRLHAMWSIGTLGGGLIAVWAARSAIPMTVQFTITSALVVIAVIVVRPSLLGDHRVRDHRVRDHRAGVHPSGTVVDTTDQVSAAHETPARAWVTAVLFITGTLAVLAELPPTEWAALVMAERFDLPTGGAGLGFVAFTAGMVTGRLGGDRFVDRLGSERFRRLSGAVAVVGVSIAAFGPAPWISLAGFFIAALGAAGLFPISIRRAGELVAGARGIAMFSAGARLGILLGPALMGIVSDQFSRAIALAAIAGTAGAISAIERLPGARTSR